MNQIDKELEKQFLTWWTGLLFDQKHFPSYFLRGIMRNFRDDIKKKFIDEAKRLGVKDVRKSEHR